MIKEVKITLNGTRFPAKLEYVGDRIFLHYGFNRAMNEEIKSSMDGAKYHGFDEKNPRKIWSVKNSPRTQFVLDYLTGGNPFAPYDGPLMEITPKRSLYKHQIEMVAHILTRHYCIFACEMGTGKSLAFIEAIDQLGLEDDEVWYIGPRAGVKAVGRELKKWDCKIQPRMLTFEGLVKVMTEWRPGTPAPKFVCFDESSKIKTPTAKRSQAALHLANAVRQEWGTRGYVVEMSGTPAPKTPVDWWHQCEVAQPGFLREGNVAKFKARLCIVEERQSITGGVYPHVVAWLDDENKCAKCGKPPNAEEHETVMGGHLFSKSKNEVANLYERMKGLVLVKFKKDCLDLPEKQYRVIHIPPTPDLLRAAKLIKSTSTRAIEAITLMRELSDGFQYKDKVIGKRTCPNCHGAKQVIAPSPTTPVDTMAPNTDPGTFEPEPMNCDFCLATGEVNEYERDTEKVESPKDDVLIDIMDEHEEGGRLIVWGGFTGTIDKLVKLSHQQGWATLRVDGRGYKGESATGDVLDTDELLDAMDGSHPRRKELLEKYPKLAFVGHPEAGGIALTLTASPTEVFYSNTYKGEDRLQAEDRGHRPGMDKNRGLTIIDLILLPTDLMILESLKNKKKLQNLTMGQLEDAFTNMNLKREV
jgi:SNF2 family DNA or RNA helicase